jgi:hypothetical protein
VVALLGAHGAPREDGTSDIDVEVITCTAPADPTLTELASEPDELDRITQARELVVLGPGVSPEVASRLRAAARAGLAIADASTAPDVLAAASPEVVLAAASAGGVAEVGVSPRTAIAIVELDGSGADRGAVAAGRVAPDFVWKVGVESEAWSELMAAWSGSR